jgi:hypothetical protein
LEQRPGQPGRNEPFVRYFKFDDFVPYFRGRRLDKKVFPLKQDAIRRFAIMNKRYLFPFPIHFKQTAVFFANQVKKKSHFGLQSGPFNLAIHSISAVSKVVDSETVTVHHLPYSYQTFEERYDPEAMSEPEEFASVSDADFQ